MNLKLAPKGIMQEIKEMRELEVQGGGECIKQEEEHMQRPRGEKGTEHSTVWLRIGLWRREGRAEVGIVGSAPTVGPLKANHLKHVWTPINVPGAILGSGVMAVNKIDKKKKKKIQSRKHSALMIFII